MQTAGPAEVQRDCGEEPGVWNNMLLALSLCVSHPLGRQPGHIGISPSGGLESCPLVAYLLAPIPLTPDGHSVLSSPLLGFTCLHGRTFPTASASWFSGNSHTNQGEEMVQLPSLGGAGGGVGEGGGSWRLLY